MLPVQNILFTKPCHPKVVTWYRFPYNLHSTLCTSLQIHKNPSKYWNKSNPFHEPLFTAEMSRCAAKTIVAYGEVASAKVADLTLSVILKTHVFFKWHISILIMCKNWYKYLLHFFCQIRHEKILNYYYVNHLYSKWFLLTAWVVNLWHVSMEAIPTLPFKVWQTDFT